MTNAEPRDLARVRTCRMVLAVLAATVLVLHTSAAVSGTSPVIDPEVRRILSERGRVRVIVELRLRPGKGQGELDARDAEERRRAIATGQDELLSRLSGTDFSISRRYDSVPFLTLELGASALSMVERMDDLVLRVSADRSVPPASR